MPYSFYMGKELCAADWDLCIVNLLSHCSTDGVSSFSVQSIQNVRRNSGLFSSIGTLSLIYLSAGWIYACWARISVTLQTMQPVIPAERAFVNRPTAWSILASPCASQETQNDMLYQRYSRQCHLTFLYIHAVSMTQAFLISIYKMCSTCLLSPDCWVQKNACFLFKRPQ